MEESENPILDMLEQYANAGQDIILTPDEVYALMREINSLCMSCFIDGQECQ